MISAPFTAMVAAGSLLSGLANERSLNKTAGSADVAQSVASSDQHAQEVKNMVAVRQNATRSYGAGHDEELISTKT